MPITSENIKMRQAKASAAQHLLKTLLGMKFLRAHRALTLMCLYYTRSYDGSQTKKRSSLNLLHFLLKFLPTPCFVYQEDDKAPVIG
jgi:hypothetical protein